MSGHSKWNNIKRRKGKTDAQKAKTFTKIGREMAVAIKEGGADPTVNFKLKDLIVKAKQNNVPNENIERAIKKAQNDSDKTNYESIVYEGYGPCGIAFLIETLTDNRNRTASEIRHCLDKYGAGLGTSGCVSFTFTQCGIIVLQKKNLSEEELMEKCLDMDILDIETDNEFYKIETEPKNFTKTLRELENMNFSIVDSDIFYIPTNFVKINNDEDSINKFNKIIAILEDNDDVINIWHNYEMNV